MPGVALPTVRVGVFWRAGDGGVGRGVKSSCQRRSRQRRGGRWSLSWGFGVFRRRRWLRFFDGLTAVC